MKKVKDIPYKILIGFLDALLPNLKESIQLQESEFYKEKPSYKVDYIRFFSSMIGFITILMGLLKMIDFNQVIAILNGM